MGYIGEYQANDSAEGQKEEYEESDNEEVEPDSGDRVTCILQRLLLTPKRESHPMRHAIFKTRCTINGKVCDLIVDSGSSENIVSETLVKTLKLPTDNHPTPYKISWVMDDTIKEVKESCTFTFSIGKKYQTTITCDVLQMNVCHVILGRPWQYDNKARYDGFKNTYDVQWREKTITFLPIQHWPLSQNQNPTPSTIDPSRLFYSHLQRASTSWILINKGLEELQQSSDFLELNQLLH